MCGTDGRSQVRPKCVFTWLFALSKGKAPGGCCERCRSLCKTASSLVVTATSLGNGLQICFADFYEYQLAGTIPMIWSQSVRRTYGAPLFSIKVSGLMTQSISVCVGSDMYLLRVQSFRDWCKVGTSKVCIICSRSWRMPLLASKCHLSSAVYSPMRCARHQTAHNSCPVCLHSRADVFLSSGKQASNDVTSFV